MSEEMVVRYCSPTLAGIKTGNIFSCECDDRRQVLTQINKMNKKLVPYGVRILLLRIKDGRALIYVYRPQMLKRDFASDAVLKMLRENGYNYDNPDICVVNLIRKLGAGGDFPHEIGLFLGYPPEDVRGFMDDSKEKNNYKYCGCWKVYDNVEKAKKLFDSYLKCTEICSERYKHLNSIEALISSC